MPRILQFRSHPVHIVVIRKVIELRPAVPLQRVGQLEVVSIVVRRPQRFVGFVVRDTVQTGLGCKAKVLAVDDLPQKKKLIGSQLAASGRLSPVLPPGRCTLDG